MSKAFTREDDSAPERPVTLPQAPSLPTGAKNYLTADGAIRFQAELEQLTTELRPPLAALPADHSDRSALSRVEQRIRQLQNCLRTAVIVKPPTDSDPPMVRFGAYVIVRDSDGEESRYRIVGADEVDLSRGWISWYSPLARALQNARPGERVQFHSPAGPREFEVIAISNA